MQKDQFPETCDAQISFPASSVDTLNKLSPLRGKYLMFCLTHALPPTGHYWYNHAFIH